MGMADRGPADRLLLQRHPNDPLKGIAFVYQTQSGTLTLTPTDLHVATIDLEIWFQHLVEKGFSNITDDVSAELLVQDE